MNQANPVSNERVWKTAAHLFRTFVKQVIGLKNEPFHEELDNNLGNPLHKKVVIAYPRGHGKSTHLSSAYPLWRIANNHDLRILLISATSQVSKSFLSEIIGHIERNEEYIKFAKFVDPQGKGVIPRMKNYAKMKENWSGESIVIDRANLNMKDPTINAVGVFGSILSKRADVIICDDIVTQENSATEEQRQKIIDWIYTTVIPVLVPGGTFIYLGNTWHPDDLVARLLKDPQFDYKNKLPAIEHESNHPELWHEWSSMILDESYSLMDRKIRAQQFYLEHKIEMDDGAKVLWPSRYPYAELYLMRMSNPYAFARMYQCDPSNRPDQSFRDEWLEEACRKGKSLRLQEQPYEGIVSEIVTEGVDLAISEDARADDTSILTLDLVKWSNIPEIKVGDVIVRNIKRGKFSPNEVRTAIKYDYEHVKPDGIRVESVAYQEAIVRDLNEAGIPVHGYHTGKEKNSPFLGVNILANLAEIGKLILPYSGEDFKTIKLISQLMNEMRAFPDGHTGDSLMALWFAYSEMVDLAGDRITVPSLMRDVNLVEKPDISIPEIRREEEKKADLALIHENEYERANFEQLMGGFWRK